MTVLIVLTVIIAIGALAPVIGVDTRTRELLARR
jgi:hypothetical protein